MFSAHNDYGNALPHASKPCDDRRLSANDCIASCACERLVFSVFVVFRHSLVQCASACAYASRLACNTQRDNIKRVSDGQGNVRTDRPRESRHEIVFASLHRREYIPSRTKIRHIGKPASLAQCGSFKLGIMPCQSDGGRSNGRALFATANHTNRIHGSITATCDTHFFALVVAHHAVR